MSAYEAEAYVRGVQRRQRAGWEQARYIAFHVLKPWAKDLTLDQMASFPWEDRQMSEEEEQEALDSLRAREQEFEQYLNNINNG